MFEGRAAVRSIHVRRHDMRVFLSKLVLRMSFRVRSIGDSRR